MVCTCRAGVAGRCLTGSRDDARWLALRVSFLGAFLLARCTAAKRRLSQDGDHELGMCARMCVVRLTIPCRMQLGSL